MLASRDRLQFLVLRQSEAGMGDPIAMKYQGSWYGPMEVSRPIQAEPF